MKTKVALVTCPEYGVLYPPLSLAYLAAALRNRDYEVVSFDFNIQLFNAFPKEQGSVYWDLANSELWRDRKIIEKTVSQERFDAWAEAILQQEPYLVGFSIYSTNEFTSLMLAEKIKARNDKIKIIFGGPYIRRDKNIAENIINQPCVDIVVVGEGEITLQEIVEAYEKEERVQYCKGAIIKSGGKIVDCGVREAINDLDSLPFADFSDFKFANYKESLVPLLASRGCLYNCAFCNEKSFWQDYRCRSAEDVIAEIKLQILNYGVNDFRFNDLMLNGNLVELEKFCDRLIQEGIKITWSGYISVRKMDKRLLEKMKHSGCNFLFCGIESGSQNILNKFKKGVEIETAEELLRLLAEVRIRVHTGWIVGFPDESDSDFKQTVDFIKRNRKYMERISLPNLMTIPPGSPIFKDPLKFGVKLIISAGEWFDNTTTLEIRQARIDYLNKYIATGQEGGLE
jgi:anaerobic magnesium-protoporphyrin IX monomethyl ester cyclase